MNSYLFRIYTAAELDQISAKLHLLLGGWVQSWYGSAAATLSVRNVMGYEDDLANGLVIAIDAAESTRRRLKHIIPIQQRADQLPAFLGNVAPKRSQQDQDFAFDAAIADRWAMSLQQAAFDDLLALSAEQASNDAQWHFNAGTGTAQRVVRKLRRGSGWCVANLTRGEAVLSLLISPALVNNWVSRPKPSTQGGLPRVRALLADQSVTVQANLGSTTLTIGDIRQLTVGDVVRLDASVDAPVQLVASGQRVAEGLLGSFEGSKAISLTK